MCIRLLQRTVVGISLSAWALIAHAQAPDVENISSRELKFQFYELLAADARLSQISKENRGAETLAEEDKLTVLRDVNGDDYRLSVTAARAARASGFVEDRFSRSVVDRALTERSPHRGAALLATLHGLKLSEASLIKLRDVLARVGVDGGNALTVRAALLVLAHDREHALPDVLQLVQQPSYFAFPEILELIAELDLDVSPYAVQLQSMHRSLLEEFEKTDVDIRIGLFDTEDRYLQALNRLLANSQQAFH